MSVARKQRKRSKGDPDEIKNTSMRAGSLFLAQLAAPFVSESMTDFLSKASDERALQILKEHNVKLPDGAVPCLAA